MVKQRKYVAKSRYQGKPKREDFEIVTTELPPLKNGEILTKAEWISVDPFQFTWNTEWASHGSYDQYGYQIAKVLDSKDPQYPVGSKVITWRGWSDYNVLAMNSGESGDKGYKLPDLKGLPESLAVGAIGMPGATAYFGLLELCKPKAGETLVVTAASGTVGSLVGQIGKMKGCKVIGFAGADAKVELLEKEFGFDKAFNYKTVDVAAALKAAAPEGVDCYFDNVGGEISSQIIQQMNLSGRVTVCGKIGCYGDGNKLIKATVLQPSIIKNQLKIQGIAVYYYWARWPEAFAAITEWLLAGKLRTEEHIVDGFHNIFDAFIDMLNGRNFGKTVVKV